MTARELAAALLKVGTDPRLTSDACRVILHYAARQAAGVAGPHPYDADELAELLEEGGPKRIAKALKRAERHGYLERHAGGRGKTDSFTLHLNPTPALTPAETDGLSDRPAETDGLSADRPAETDGLKASRGEEDACVRASSNQPPIHPTNQPPGGAIDVENSTGGAAIATLPPAVETEAHTRLREWLGPHADAVDVFEQAAPHASSWPAAVVGKFGPAGTQRQFWRGVDEAREPEIVAEALRDYAANESRPFRANLFEGYLRRARDGAPEKPRRPPPPAPGTEAARVLGDYSRETPGGYRAQRGGGGGGLARLSIPPSVQQNLHRTATQNAGAGASEEAVAQIERELTAAYLKHHGPAGAGM